MFFHKGVEHFAVGATYFSEALHHSLEPFFECSTTDFSLCSKPSSLMFSRSISFASVSITSRDSPADSLIRIRRAESSCIFTDSRLWSKSCACCIESMSLEGAGIDCSTDGISADFLLKSPNGGTMIVSSTLHQKRLRSSNA